jgi:hypothetical protein
MISSVVAVSAAAVQEANGKALCMEEALDQTGGEPAEGVCRRVV